MKPRTPLSPSALLLTAIISALLAASLAWAQGDSQARIVRLSFVQGDVSVQRPDVQAWAQAPANTPLQQGFQLSTADQSFAEVQFENRGTIRLGEGSLLDLTSLERAADGGTVDHVALNQGYATFHPLFSALGGALEVGTAYGTVSAPGGALFRVDLQQGAERVEVFEGAVEVQSNLGNYSVDKDSMLVLQPGTTDASILTRGITRDDWDNWVDDREADSALPPNAPAPNTYTGEAEGSTYGWNDLLQYGTWSNVPGMGYGWSPTLAASGWAPYANGQWCWYQGYGYTWIGAEPWGWLPYHYGGWEFIPGKNWVWFPVSLRTWSPGRVTWYHGPNWVGWTPRHIKDGAACGAHCGGGAVSTSIFRNGGRLTSSVMLGLNPTTGERVREPGIVPGMAGKLTGPAVSFRGAPASNSTIVYDPQTHAFVNSDRIVTPQPPTVAVPPTAARHRPEHSGRTEPDLEGEREAQPSQVQGIGHPEVRGGGYSWQNIGGQRYERQPVPPGGREHDGRDGNQSYGGSHPSESSTIVHPTPALQSGPASPYAAPPTHGNTANPPAPAPHANPSLNRMGGGQPGGGHGGGSEAGGSHPGGASHGAGRGGGQGNGSADGGHR